MIILLTFFLLHASLLWNVVGSLECYTGFSVIRGQTVGTTKEVCSKESDSCYRAMADVNLLSTIKKAGCSTLRCYLNRNKCIEQELFGSKVKFCCCDDRDLCNVASTTSFAVIISIAVPFFFIL
uniref:Activin types I and II receptor domain-containing protein n=1 Tax=Onchocerca volvulus TaxID=6282 RepID=A0A2K6W1X7_ONCVO